MSAAFVQARFVGDLIAEGASGHGKPTLDSAGLAKPSQRGAAQVTALTRSELIRMTLRAMPASPVFSGELEPTWPSDQVADEHVAVSEAVGKGPEVDRSTSIADVLVRRAGGPGTCAQSEGAALVTCIADLEARTCALSSRHGGKASFTVCGPSAGHGASDMGTAFAWAASFAHCLLVQGRALTELQAARLVICDSECGKRSVALVPCAPLTVQA